MAPPADLVIETERLRLGLLRADDAPRVLDFVRRNRAYFAPWDPPRPDAYWTEAYWRSQLALFAREALEERSLRLYALPRADARGPVVALVHFSRLVRGPFQCAGLGYALDQAHEGRGLMREALRGAIGHMFDELGYHRIEANYRPENIRSGKVLAALGFVVEGYARNYLMIDGAWRDHILTSLTRETPAAPPGA